jgi:transposase
MATLQPITSAHVPDLEQVRAWLQKMIASMRFVELIMAIIGLITRMRDINTELNKRLAHLSRKRPRSETLKRVERQLSLPFMQSAEAKPPQSSTDNTVDKPKASRKGQHPGRRALPAHLERITVDNPVPPAMRKCPQCGGEMTTVGHSMCEILDVIPARVVVMQRRDERVACPRDNAIVSAPTPNQLVERGVLGTTLIVEATADKYLEHQPIERQCNRYRRAGVDVAPQTLGHSVAVHIDWLQPIAKAITERTRGPGLLGTDATGIPILDRDAPDGIRIGTVWCWTNARWVTFFYSAAGDSDSVRRFLGEDLCRTVQCDGTNIMTFIERAGGKRPGCWSHARRGLVEVARSGETVALEGVRLIRRLFAVERWSTLCGDTAQQRLTRRIEYSTPAINAIRAWLDKQRETIAPKTAYGQALGYIHRQWRRLIFFLEDGNIELTNNRRERELRKLVLGKKNWLFAWEDLGGERTANILTIVATCVAHAINPRAYLHVVTRLLIEGWPHKRLSELLPDRIAAMHPELRLPSAVKKNPSLPELSRAALAATSP